MKERSVSGAFLVKVLCGMILSCTAMLAVISGHTYTPSADTIEIQFDDNENQCNSWPYSESEEREEIEDMMLLWSSHSYIDSAQRNPSCTGSHIWSHSRIITPPPEESVI